jgi:hypothetical protein
VSDQPRTVRQRCLDAGISPERLDQHHAAGLLRLDGEPVTDLDQPTEPGSRITIWNG